MFVMVILIRGKKKKKEKVMGSRSSLYVAITTFPKKARKNINTK